MKRLLIVAFVATACTTSAWAIDRDANNIDGVTVMGWDYSKTDDLRVQAWTEMRLPTIEPDWALIASAGLGDISPSQGEDVTSWSGSLGVKYYFSELLSVSAEGMYRGMDVEHSDILGVITGAGYRFISPEEPISPFVRGSLGLQRVRSSADAWLRNGDASAQLLLVVGAGCDLLLRDDLAISLELAVSTAERITADGPEYGDGWGGAISMRYYFD